MNLSLVKMSVFIMNSAVKGDSMKQIRKNTFETNSSSTHAIAFSDNYRKYSDEDLLNLKGTFKPFTRNDVPKYLYVYDTLEDKLRWLLSSIAQTSDEYSTLTIKSLLAEVLPNAELVLLDEDNYYYALEDIDIMWEEWDNKYPGQKLEDKDTLIKFLKEGVVIWGSRDHCSIDRSFYHSDVELKLREFDNILLKYTG